MSDQMPIRVRFAPSPTGELHLGGARTALFSYLFTKQTGGTYILRIEDTDQTRYVPGSMERFFTDLTWLGISFDEGPQVGGEFGPYIQSERTELYQQAAQKLINEGYTYKCFCTVERLSKMRAAQAAAKQPTRYDRHCLSLSAEVRSKNEELRIPHVVRMKVPEGQTTFVDLVRGKITVNNKEIDDQVLLKSDGFPTYHLAVVVDDHHMQVSHVFRAEEWLPSTPKHLILYKMFGWTPPLHAHLPMILNKERRKLSKRKDGETVWIANYRRQGYLPEAMINYLALLGWNSGDEREFFTLPELVMEFSLDRVHRAGAIFDLEKLNFINAHYLRRLANDEIVKWLRLGDFLSPELSKQDNRQLARWVQITRERMQILAEFEPLVWPIISLTDYPASRLIFKKSDQQKTLRALKSVKSVVAVVPESGWDNQDSLQVQLSNVVASGDFTNGDVFWPTRVALSGLEASPSPAELLWVLGKVEGLTRVERAIVKLS